MALINAESKLCDVILNEPSLIPVINRFGIILGVGDKNIRTVCDEKNLDCEFFVTILNTFINEDYFPENRLKSFCATQIVDYLTQTNAYYQQFQIPNIERHFNSLISQSDSDNNNLELMKQFFEELKKELLSRIERDRTSWFPAIRAAAEQLRLLENGPRAEQIAAAEANAARAEAAYEKAKTLVSYKTLYSPVAGTVLTKNYEEGDVIAAGAPVATLGDLTDCWVKLYIPSTQLSLVKLGAKCSVFVDPFPNKAFEATVTEINQQAEYNPRMSLTQSERANMVFWIKVSIKDTEGVIKPGMPADVTIL